MIRFSMAVVASVCFAVPATAADLLPPPPAPASWAGTYVGIHGGITDGIKGSASAAASAAETQFTPATSARGDCSLDGTIILTDVPEGNCDLPNTTWTQTADAIPGVDIADTVDDMAKDSLSRRHSFLLGGQAGHNWQRGNVVFGFEGDVSGYFRGTKSTTIEALADLGDADSFDTRMMTTVSASAKLDWSSTVRGRVGHVVANDFLPFITGGVAFGKVHLKGGATFEGELGLGGPGFEEFVPLGRDQIRVGYAIGAGVDYRVNDRVFLNFTYLHVDLGSISSSASFADSRGETPNESEVSGRASIKSDARFNVFRIGVNVRF